MSTLFIGGEHDGKRMSVPDLPYIELPCKPTTSLDWVGPNHKSPIRTETYRRETFAADEERVFIYIFDDLSAASAMKALIDNYKPQKP